ncbi:MAG: HAD family hydrolase [Phycisphaeraceae bacterium JB051]
MNPAYRVDSYSDGQPVTMDFDLTLYDHADPQKTATLHDLFMQLHSHGVKLGIVSGRTIDELQQPLSEIGMPWEQPFPQFMIFNDGQISPTAAGDYSRAAKWNRELDVLIAEANNRLSSHSRFVAKSSGFTTLGKIVGMEHCRTSAHTRFDLKYQFVWGTK